ncbi:DNA recombination protein RmuC [Acetobacter pasteurianus]|uniref:DNA recombination protein RmuC homolog n=1 Tax=Acetobacter pasteurianus TaxID=438 RepID=A0A1A0DCN3_ACEPA|nr:DNA recombination protein RmuC [Acetobacter pasteurianus]OAZ72785.1 DNA recombination protein RmuC like protein [Acetobacter pasteurianus]RCL10461.1 DNA recombination protein RmuC [Acetobacter pasteurianus]GAB29528.1 DNA recombinase RmuC [Acetobacter pasteurianus subsp. pasteurianus LMG 1262 = NBRC 106471]GCD49273.1 DNA recombinase RmuC [Acetobacter pasteurianus subsp. pasteurianus LMG 1262 = NBRC 106471]
MSSIIVLLSIAVCALLLGAGLTILLRPKSGGTDADLLARLYVLVEREAATARSDIAAQRNSMVEMERAMGGRIERMRTELAEQLGALAGGLGREQAEARAAQAEALRNLADTSAQQLASIRRAVTEQLHEAVEQQMQTSFQRVLEQFSAMQKAMGEVRAMTGQIGDLKRLFSNVKTRGGWGEAQLRAILDDVLPPGTYESNVRIGNGNDVVEFAIRMPVKSSTPPLLPVDSKFPTEAYERLLNAADEGDAAGEKAARKSLENTMRLEARKISSKYIHPPKTVEFAVLYLPTDGLYTEVARMPGLIDDLGRQFRVMVMGPALMPAMLRTIHLGYVTLALEERTETIARLLGATRQEMIKMDGVLDKLARNAQAMSFSIEEARRRTRSVSRKLRELDEPEDNASGTEESEIEFTGVDSNGTASV